jgi:hypothetical protein
MAAQVMKLNAMRADPREGSGLDAGPIDSASTREQAQRCCPRFGGFLVDERCLDLYDGRIVGRLDRCIPCGNLEDALLLQNRVRSPVTRRSHKTQKTIRDQEIGTVRRHLAGVSHKSSIGSGVMRTLWFIGHAGSHSP